MAIELIIFDIGGVLIDINLDNVIYYWAKKSGFPKIDINVRNGTYFDFERGKASAQEYHESIVNDFGLDLSFDDFVIGWNLMLSGTKPGIMDLLKTLATRKLAILSNTNPLHEKEFFRNYRELMLHFNYLGFSHYLGYLKPQPEAYQTVLEYFNIKPQEAIFIDDKQINIDGATGIGMHGICSSDVRAMEKEIGRIVDDG